MKRLVLLSTALLLAATWSFAAEAQGFPDISHADLKAAIASNTVTLIDCNGEASYTKCHIPGALSFNAIKDSLADKLPKEKDALIVAYCGGPKCGAYKAGANAVQALGYTNVKHYSAGISGWKDANEKCDTSAEKQTGSAGGCGGCGGCGG